jgi:hypothetical protein
MAATLERVDEAAVDETMERGIGAVQQALLVGVMLQWLLDPDHAPTEHDLTNGLRALSTRAGGTAPTEAASGDRKPAG